MFSAWLCYFDPTEQGRGDGRSWSWWDAGVIEPDDGRDLTYGG